MTIENKNELIKSSDNELLVILKQNRKAVRYFFVILIIVYLFYIFCVTLPVLKTGEYAAVCIANDSLFKKVALFYTSWIMYLYVTPFLLITVRRFGNYYFYSDRLEFESLFFGRVIIIPYNQLIVIKKQKRLFIKTTVENVFTWSNPLQHFKVEYWDRLVINAMFEDVKVLGVKAGLTRGWENPADGLKAIQILKEKASAFIEKN